MDSLSTRIEVLVTITVTITVATIPNNSMNKPSGESLKPPIPERLKAIEPRACP